MGPVILIIVLLHALSSYWQSRKQPVVRGRADLTVLVRAVIAIKEFVILPVIVLMLLFYSFDPAAGIWLTVGQPSAIWIKITGIIFAVSSILLKVHAYNTLGNNWSAVPMIRAGHSLVREGPYAYVRHPVYASNILMLLGTFLATSSLSFLMMGIFYFATDVIRANEEERKLTMKFGGSYDQYRATVGKYVPRTVTYSFIGVIIACNAIGILYELAFNLMC